MKKTILHIIHDLGRGGAETMLVSAVNELHDYNNIVVTLFDKNHFKEELKCHKYYCLHLKSLKQLPLGVLRLRKIIRDNKIDMVHSHLFWPTFLSRISTPRKIPLLTTIHAFIATSFEYKFRLVRVLDKLTYRLRKNIIIAVAEGAKTEYFNFLKLKPYKAYTLYTFVDTRIFNPAKHTNGTAKNGIFKLVSVGALRHQKNQKFLLEAFKTLDKTKFQLDIYGDGDESLHKCFRETIDDHQLNVNLKGAVRNIPEIINNYDLFVMSSTFEGFSLGVLEAMAMEMPLLLSNISSFKEQCGETAVYFNLVDTNDFIAKLEELSTERNKLKLMAARANDRVLENFTLEHHMHNLRKIYSETTL